MLILNSEPNKIVETINPHSILNNIWLATILANNLIAKLNIRAKYETVSILKSKGVMLLGALDGSNKLVISNLYNKIALQFIIVKYIVEINSVLNIWAVTV